MLVAAEPVLPDWGVPPPADMERYEGGGMSGLAGTWEWAQGMIDTVVGKVSIPGFGTPKLDPGTVIQTGPSGETLVRQQPGFPVGVPPPTSTKTEFNLGAAAMIGGAILLGMVVLGKMGGSGGGHTRRWR